MFKEMLQAQKLKVKTNKWTLQALEVTANKKDSDFKMYVLLKQNASFWMARSWILDEE